MTVIVKLLIPLHTYSTFTIISFSAQCKLYGLNKYFVLIHTASTFITILSVGQCKLYDVRKSHIVLVSQIVR